MTAHQDPTAMLAAFVDMLASAVAAKLAAAPPPSAPTHYSRDDLPPNTSRSKFNRAARAGEFPSFKRGNLILARRVDVDAWLESNARPARGARRMPVAAPTDPAVLSIATQLAAGGSRR